MGQDPFNRYKAGIHNVGSYQVAGIPWITGSAALKRGQEVKYRFPKVTKSITVINRSAADIRVHFHTTGAVHPSGVMTGSHFVLMDSKEDSYTFNVKASEIYVTAPHDNASDDASFTIIAELTGIEIPTGFNLTGSGISSLDGT
tara:strand:+ start:1376 stop:1807 length:432 start_codon:yes stop_codon:yes gene_type:complete